MTPLQIQQMNDDPNKFAADYMQGRSALQCVTFGIESIVAGHVDELCQEKFDDKVEVDPATMIEFGRCLVEHALSSLTKTPAPQLPSLCDIRGCSNEDYLVRVNENVGDGCFRVDICPQCAIVIGVDKDRGNPQVAAVDKRRRRFKATLGTDKSCEHHAGFICQANKGRGPHKTMVVVYDASRQDFADATGDRFLVVCQKHKTHRSTSSHSAAHSMMHTPGNFCEQCMMEMTHR